jgi:hypothetical protein
VGKGRGVEGGEESGRPRGLRAGGRVKLTNGGRRVGNWRGRTVGDDWITTLSGEIGIGGGDGEDKETAEDATIGGCRLGGGSDGRTSNAGE